MQAVRETVGLRGKLLARCMFCDKRTKALPAGTEGAYIRGPEAVYFKVGSANAYDKLNWNFLEGRARGPRASKL